MKKVFLLASSNLKKHKWHTISFILMITLAMSMLVAGLVTYLDCDQNFDRRSEYLKAEDCMFAVTNTGYNSNMQKEIQESGQMDHFKQKDVMLSYATIGLADGTVNTRVIFFKKNLEDEIGRSEMLDTASETFENPIYLPLLFKDGGGYQLGDSFEVEIDKEKYSFHVQGFFENLSLGSSNMPVMGFMLEDEEYARFSQMTKGVYDGQMFLMKLKDRKNASSFIADLYSRYSKTNEHNIVSVRTYYSGCKGARTFVSKIVASIIVAFSFLVVVIAMVIIRFRIINSIQDDIKSIGTLKAMGYTNANLIASYVVQFVMVSVVGILLGLGVASLILPFIAKALEAQSGMVWNMKISSVLVICVGLLILVIVSLTILLTTRRIKKLAPITALRNGLMAHSFRKNHFPFAKTKGNVNLLFGLKNFVVNKHQNIMVCGIIAGITFMVLFTYTFYYNLAVDSSAFVDTVVGEVPSVKITLEERDADILDKLTTDSRVRKALYWSTQSVFVEGRGIYAYVTDDYSRCDSNLCYKGRSPINDNEIAIGGLAAEELNKDVGDEIELSLGDKKYTYLISGLIQSGNNMGYDAELTTEGIKNLSKVWKAVDIFVYLNDESQTDNYIVDVKKEIGSNITNASSTKDMIDTQLGAYIDVATLITIIIMVFTALIITLVLYLVIKTMLNKNKSELGIQKAIGYSTRQLVLQMGLSFVPVALIGTMLGYVVGLVATNPLFCTMLRSLGIMKFNLVIQPMHHVVIMLILSIYIVLMALAVSVRIRKISAYKLIIAD